MRTSLAGRVLITGGAGSLGQALVDRGYEEGWDWQPVVYSRDEAKQAGMRERHPSCSFVLGDVRDRETLDRALRGIDVLVHAGALKRVPEAEVDTPAYVRANILGSMTVVEAALAAGTPRVIGISTDKASAPVGAYGQTKAVMERLFQSAVSPWGPRFTLCRYGNVIASTGSVIPMLQKQAAAGGPLTITDLRMSRFWITLDDAVELIVNAQAIDSGEILIPKSKASTMAVLAQAVAPNVPIEEVGSRGGERDHEQLVNELEGRYTRESGPHGRFYVMSPMHGHPADLMAPDFHLRSDDAEQFSVEELALVVHSLSLGLHVSTMP